MASKIPTELHGVPAVKKLLKALATKAAKENKKGKTKDGQKKNNSDRD